MKTIQFGAATRLIQSKAQHPGCFALNGENPKTTRRFDDYIAGMGPAGSLKTITPRPNERLVLDGEDVAAFNDEMRQAMSQAAPGFMNSLIAQTAMVFEFAPPAAKAAQEEVVSRYLLKAEQDGKMIDLDA